MVDSVWSRCRKVFANQAREPGVLVLALTGMGLVALLALGVAGIVALPAFCAHGWWAFAAAALALAWLVWQSRRRSAAEAASRRRLWLLRLLGLGKGLFAGLLACWLGLILWWELAPGGPMPEAKADPALVRVITWNLHCGREGGPWWERFDWAGRKQALRAAVEQAGPDLLCVQEALPEQVEFLEQVLPGHGRVGVGRDGGSAGEHCAVFFRRDRFEEVANGTFWLEEPIDEPRPGSVLTVKRACTWAQLRDRERGQTVRVYNTHLYLTEAARLPAARLIVAQIAADDPGDAVLLAADFNAPPSAPSRRHFLDAGLADSATLAGTPDDAPTYHLYGIGLSRLDGILVGPGWQVRHHRILSVKPGGTFPSDHHGVLADLALPE
jgi:endonuclease/exonuclease/phosphatase family metal-dependent hydrolase